ncbi:MAG: hydrogenase maturation protease [Gammaproteobacteria bacterium]|nr:hydrogenase maturation protease [Gammaproteobacteria bacterium]
MSADDADCLVIGVGNPDRADDGAGPLVAMRLQALRPPRVRVTMRGGDLLSLIDDWAGARAVVVVDAAAPLARPGTIHRWTPGTGELPRPPRPSSTHGFGVAEVLALAAHLGRVPQTLVVYAIEGARFDLGAAMTPAVRRAALALARRLGAGGGVTRATTPGPPRPSRGR